VHQRSAYVGPLRDCRKRGAELASVWAGGPAPEPGLSGGRVGRIGPQSGARVTQDRFEIPPSDSTAKSVVPRPRLRPGKVTVLIQLNWTTRWVFLRYRPATKTSA